MNKMFSKFAGMSAIAALALAAPVAMADTVTLNLQNLAFTTTAYVSSNSGASFTNTYVSFLNGNVTNPVGPLATSVFNPLPADVDVFCIQLLQSIGVPSSNTFNFGTLAASGSPDGPPGPLSALQQKQILNMYSNADGNQYINATNAAAFQLALWEITFDGNGVLNEDAGVFQVKPLSAVVEAALDGYLASTVSDLNNNDPDLTMYAFQNGRVQDFVIDLERLPGGGDEDLPEPGSMALLGLGLVGLAGTRRRFVK